MKIAIGKIGKSIQFGPTVQKKGIKAMTAGSIDARIVFEKLIEYNPQHTFYIVGRSNWQRLSDEIRDSINKHGNVIDLWDDWKEWRNENRDRIEDPKEMDWRYIDEHALKKHDPSTFDVGLFFAGGIFTYAVQGRSLRQGKRAKTLAAGSTYSGPLHHFINETKLPWVALVTDPRCFGGNMGDLMHPPTRIVSQYIEDMPLTHKLTYEEDDTVKEAIRTEYIGLESLYTIDLPTYTNDLGDFFDEKSKPEEPRDVNMVLFLNEGKPSRYNDLKHYVLDHIDDVKVYGAWSDKALKDPRIETVPMALLTHLFPRIKYTFCIPIKTGWCTGKFWDMINMGIIPFMHPEYDTQKLIGFPEELRVKDSEDFLNKITYYNENESEYQALLNRLKSMITPEHRSGKLITDNIMKIANEIAHED